MMQLRNKDDLLEQSNLKEEQLTTTIKNLEKLLLEKTEVSHYPSQSLTDDNQQQVALEKEVNELQTECVSIPSVLFFFFFIGHYKAIEYYIILM